MAHHFQNTTNSFLDKAYFRLRQKLVEDQIIVDYKFIKDYEFKAPSAASSVVLGRPSNGKLEWKTKNGQVFDEFKIRR